MTEEDEAFENLAKRQGDWGMQGSRKHQIMRYAENVENKGTSMNRNLYDFTTPPDTPKVAHSTMYYFPHEQKSGAGLYPRSPAFNDLPCMAAHYDLGGNLLFTRFIFKDGTWRDEK